MLIIQGPLINELQNFSLIRLVVSEEISINIQLVRHFISHGRHIRYCNKKGELFYLKVVQPCALYFRQKIVGICIKKKKMKY